jgi:putative DNA primase/helicase
VRTLVLPGAPPKGDVSDWINAGGTADQLWALVEQSATECKVPPHHKPDQTTKQPAHNSWNQEAWPHPVDGLTLANKLAETYSNHVVLPEHGATAVTLWTIYTHAFDAFSVSPILAVESPEKRCGKTTLLELLELLVQRGYMTANTSTPVVFRVADQHQPTLIFDEAETYITPDKKELIGIINAGWKRRSSWVDRCEGDSSQMKVRRFRAWCPKAVGLIGNIADIRDTLDDRSIRLRMQRKRTDQHTAELREDRIDPFIVLQRQTARWAADHMDALRAADPPVPEALNDRARQNWRPLLAVAQTIGGEWPEKAKAAAAAISAPSDTDEDSGGVLLLRHCKEIFEASGYEWLTPTDLVHHLCADPEWPWATWRRGSDPITTRGVYNMLKSFRIQSQKSGRRAYAREAFKEAWAHYL